MTRLRVGTTAAYRNGRSIAITQKLDGTWITTGEARGWPRCGRCRKPVEELAQGAPSALCHRCWVTTDRENPAAWDAFRKYGKRRWRAHADHLPPETI